MKLLSGQRIIHETQSRPSLPESGPPPPLCSVPCLFAYYGGTSGPYVLGESSRLNLLQHKRNLPGGSPLIPQMLPPHHAPK